MAFLRKAALPLALFFTSLATLGAAHEALRTKLDEIGADLQDLQIAVEHDILPPDLLATLQASHAALSRDFSTIMSMLPREESPYAPGSLRAYLFQCRTKFAKVCAYLNISKDLDDNLCNNLLATLVLAAEDAAQLAMQERVPPFDNIGAELQKFAAKAFAAAVLARQALADRLSAIQRFFRPLVVEARRLGNFLQRHGRFLALLVGGIALQHYLEQAKSLLPSGAADHNINEWAPHLRPEFLRRWVRYGMFG